MVDILRKVEEIAQGIPPVDNKASRFGNPAFRTFYDKIGEVCVPVSDDVNHADSTSRLRRIYMRRFLGFHRRRYPKFRPTSRKHGATERVSIMAAAWN